MKVILFFIVCFLFLSIDSFAQLRPAQSQYLQQTGALVNPSFEQGYKGWLITGDCTQSLESDIPYLNKTLKLTCVNQSFTVKQNTDLSAFVDQQALITAQVKANIGGMSVNSLTNDVISTTASVIAGDYKSINIPVKVGATSNGVEFSATSVTGEFFIDEVSLRLAPDLSYQVGQAQFVGSVTYKDNDCNWERSSATYGTLITPTLNTCFATEVIGNVQAPSPSDNPFITIPNFRTDGYYQIIHQGLKYNDSNSGTCYFNISKDSNESNNSAIWVSANDGDGDNHLTANIRFEQGDTGNVQIIAKNTGGLECSVRGQVEVSSSWSVHFYPDSNSTIVAQDTELTAKTVNRLTATFTDTGSCNEIEDDFSFVASCTRSTTGTYDIVFESGVFTSKPAIHLSAGDGASREVNYQTLSLTGLTIVGTAAGSTQDLSEFTLTAIKTGNDVNKSQTIIGKFEQIDSTPLCQVEAFGNDGEALTTGEDTPFKTIVKDNCNAWSNVGNTGNNTNDAYTAQKNGFILITGSIVDGTIDRFYRVYEDGVTIDTSCTNRNTSNNLLVVSCMVNAKKDSVYTIRPVTNTTLVISNLHRIKITELPDTASIVENLNRSKVINSYAETNSKIMRVESCKIGVTTGRSFDSNYCSTWVDSVGDGGTGTTTLNFKSGVFTEPPMCTANILGTVGVMIVDQESTSSVRVRTFNSATQGIINANFTIQCQGVSN